MLSHIFELYSSNGESLIDIGINEAVLPIEYIDKALFLFFENNILVSGGDLYIKNSVDGFESFYADWFYHGTDCLESIENARGYLDQFKSKDVYVSFIVK
ncbi:hypothetical protein ABFW07_00245 [Acinetobacter soli]|uniref:hypothetical protein n=2 Tax=Acinetobacter TaxID=469 RepID=UPI00124FC277|nr:hypothetical protein [Acinetobacter soli]